MFHPCARQEKSHEPFSVESFLRFVWDIGTIPFVPLLETESSRTSFIDFGSLQTRS
jgi:hypothetical protein